MADPDARQLQLIKKFFALLGSDQPGEAANAKSMLLELLQKLGCTWNDLPRFLRRTSSLRRVMVHTIPQSTPGKLWNRYTACSGATST